MTEGILSPVRVLVVDDSRFYRSVLTEFVNSMPGFKTIFAAGSASEAVIAATRFQPELITMDVEMPGQSGLGAVAEIMRACPTRILMVSAFTATGAETALAALEIGAIEVIEKPSASRDLSVFRSDFQASLRSTISARIPSLQPCGRPATPIPRTDIRRIAIAGSTGAIQPLSALIHAVSVPHPPIIIAQHLPHGFTDRLASRLASDTGLDVAVAAPGERLHPSRIRLLPAEWCAAVVDNSIERAAAPKMSMETPNADLLFQTLGSGDLAIVLSGMGRDGSASLPQITAAGAQVLVQDPLSCIASGMPEAALRAAPNSQSGSVSALCVEISTICKGFQGTTNTREMERSL